MNNMTYILLALLVVLPIGRVAAIEIESVDLVLQSLKLDLSKPESGNVGAMQFQSLDFYSSDLFINLYNDGKVFDSSIYFGPKFIGIRGSNHALGINMDTSALKGFSGFEFDNSSFHLDTKLLSLESENFNIMHDKLSFSGVNTKFYCNKHPDHPGNTTEAFKYGCLSDSSLISLDGSNPIEFNTEVYSINDEGDSLHASAKINKVEFKTTQINMALDQTEVVIDNLINFSVDQGSVVCKKNGDIENFNPNNLVYDCIDDFSFQLNNVELSGISKADAEVENSTDIEYKVKSKKPAVVLDNKSLIIKTDEVQVDFDNINLKANNIYLTCNKNKEGVSNKDIDLLARTCLDTSKLIQRDNKMAHAEIILSDISGINIMGDAVIKSIEMNNGDLQSELGFSHLNLDESIIVGTHGMKLSCETNFALPEIVTRDNLEAIDFKSSMDSCLNNIQLPKTSFFITNGDRNSRYYIDNSKTVIQDNQVDVDLNAIQLVSKEGSSTLMGVIGSCYKKKDISPYEYKELIDGCLDNGTFTINSVINDDENDEAKNIFDVYNKIELSDREDINPILLIKKIKPSLKDIKVNSDKGRVVLTTKVPILGAYKSAKLSGEAIFDKESEKLIIKIKDTKLPFGISSEKLSLFLIKQLIANDRIDVSATNKTITIDLRFK